MNPEESIPSISALELAEWMHTRPDLILLDVREPFEVAAARISDLRVFYSPLSVLAQSASPALPPAALNPQAPMVVFCHLGLRSAQVVWWLRQMGWEQVYNLTGGIDDYAAQVDPSIGFY